MVEKREMRTVLDYLKRFFFVRKCVSCKTILAYEEANQAFCPSCNLRWSASKSETCGECFKSAVECICMPKKLSKSGALCLRKLVFYNKNKQNEAQSRIIYFLKRNKNRRAAEFIARELSGAIKKEADILEVSDMSEQMIITWVPRTRKAKAEYGFDQSELVCRAIEKLLGIPCAPLILRKLGGREQKKLNRNERIKNAQNRFMINSKIAIPEGKTVLLFDDVVTTGASMSECVSLIRKKGIKSVICLTIAKN